MTKQCRFISISINFFQMFVLMMLCGEAGIQPIKSFLFIFALFSLEPLVFIFYKTFRSYRVDYIVKQGKEIDALWGSLS